MCQTLNSTQNFQFVFQYNIVKSILLNNCSFYWFFLLLKLKRTQDLHSLFKCCTTEGRSPVLRTQMSSQTEVSFLQQLHPHTYLGMKQCTFILLYFWRIKNTSNPESWSYWAEMKVSAVLYSFCLHQREIRFCFRFLFSISIRRMSPTLLPSSKPVNVILLQTPVVNMWTYRIMTFISQSVYLKKSLANGYLFPGYFLGWQNYSTKVRWCATFSSKSENTVLAKTLNSFSKLSQIAQTKQNYMELQHKDSNQVPPLHIFTMGLERQVFS